MILALLYSVLYLVGIFGTLGNGDYEMAAILFAFPVFLACFTYILRRE
jgi:hypothetical protein